jgi:alpha-amylase
MVDVVANHVAYDGAPSNVNYTQFNPFNAQKYYHPYCKIDAANTTSVQDCWMGDTVVSLPDLRTEDAAVQTGYQTWIKQLVSNYSIDGLRLDSAMETNQGFWPNFVTASGVYAVGEVLDGNPNSLCAWQNYMPGMLNYATYFWVINAFAKQSAMTVLSNNIQWLNTTCQDVTLLGNFMENHDQARFASMTSDTGLTKNALAFTVFNDGIPIIYYGQEQGFSGTTDPYNREPLWTSAYTTKASLYTFIATLNAARNLAIYKDTSYASSFSTVWYSDSQTVVTSKGASSSPLISLFTNRGAAASGNITLTAAKTGIQANTKFTDLLSCDTFTADSSGNLVINISSGLPRTLYLSSKLSGNDLCASTNTAKACTTASTVAVSFSENVQTQWLEKVSIAGSIAELGKWATASAFNLSSANYTAKNTVWSGTVNIAAGTSFQYKIIKYNSTSNAVTWEADPNRSYTVQTSCNTSATMNDVWQT